MDNPHLNKNTINWHSLSISSVLEGLKTNEQGLSFKEAKKRRKIYGINHINSAPASSSIKRFLVQFNNILIYVLLISALTSLMLGDWLDFIVIFCIVILNSTIAFLQERKTENALRAIQSLLSPQANVIRNGKRHTIFAKSLVPGDIVVLQSGDKVPADLRLFNVRSLLIQEAALTGESYSVEKIANPVPEDISLADRSSMAYSGTLVTYGRGEGIVVAIGDVVE